MKRSRAAQDLSGKRVLITGAARGIGATLARRPHTRGARVALTHVGHPGGYALAVASLAAAVHAPLMGAYSASKAAVEALGTDMTSRGFPTEAPARIARDEHAPLTTRQPEQLP